MTISCTRVFQQHRWSVFNEWFIKHSQGVISQIRIHEIGLLWKGTPTEIHLHSRVSHKILLQKVLNPLTVKFIGTGISDSKTVFSCYLTWYVLLLHLIFPTVICSSKFFPAGGLLDRSSLIHNFGFSFQNQKNWKNLTVVKCIFLQCAMMWFI